MTTWHLLGKEIMNECGMDGPVEYWKLWSPCHSGAFQTGPFETGWSIGNLLSSKYFIQGHSRPVPMRLAGLSIIFCPVRTICSKIPQPDVMILWMSLGVKNFT